MRYEADPARVAVRAAMRIFNTVLGSMGLGIMMIVQGIVVYGNAPRETLAFLLLMGGLAFVMFSPLVALVLLPRWLSTMLDAGAEVDACANVGATLEIDDEKIVSIDGGQRFSIPIAAINFARSRSTPHKAVIEYATPFERRRLVIPLYLYRPEVREALAQCLLKGAARVSEGPTPGAEKGDAGLGSVSPPS